MERTKKGTFVKGHKPSKPKGAISAKTKAWEELGEYIVGEGAASYMNHLKTLDPEHYMQRFEAVLEYFKPKLQRTESKVDAQMQIQVIPILGGITNAISGDNSDKKANEIKEKN